MEIIGLTGGIGSGKSTVARMFESLGIPIYYADREAKDLMISSESLRAGIIDLLGEEAYINNVLNRAYIAEIVFNNKDKLQSLNELVHPEVQKHFEIWVKNKDAPYVIQENALIFEKNQQDRYDQVVLVVADENTRIQRVMKRDDSSKDQVLERISNQLSDKEKIRFANFVINNDSLIETKNQVEMIHKKLSESIS